LILTVLLFAAMITWSLYDWVINDEGIRYFASQPTRLLIVAGLGLLGGIVAWGLSHLSNSVRRTLALLVVGVLATVVTGVLAVIVCRMTTVVSLIVESGLTISVSSFIVLFAILAALIWLEFSRLWMQK